MSDKRNKILTSLFHDGMIDDLKYILKSSSDNIMKSNLMLEYLKPYGFKKTGRGTNILVVEHKKKHKNLVFKIALDSYGINDNFVDMIYTNDIVDYVTVYECHRTGMISVHDKVRIIKNDNEARRYYPQMEKILKRLKKDYLLCDLSLRTFRNFGLVKDKKKKQGWRLVLADGSDLVPLQNGIELECYNKLLAKPGKGGRFKTKLCGGKLKYDEEFYELVCQDCGKAYNPTEIYKAKFKEVDVLADKRFSLGLSEKEEQALNKSILKRREQESKEVDPSQFETEDQEEMRKVNSLQPEEKNEAEDDSEETDDNENTSIPSCNFVCDRCDIDPEDCPMNHGDEDEEIEDDDDESEEDDSDDEDEQQCCQANGPLSCDDCDDKNVFSYCTCNVCDKKHTCELAYGSAEKQKPVQIVSEPVEKIKKHKSQKGLKFEKDSKPESSEHDSNLQQVGERIAAATEEELKSAEEIKTAIANGEMLQGDPTEAPFIKQATIYDGEDVRRDLDMLKDGPIKVELDAVGETVKDINIMIDGKMPASTNIKVTIINVTENGTDTKEVSLLEVLQKINEIEQE